MTNCKGKVLRIQVVDHPTNRLCFIAVFVRTSTSRVRLHSIPAVLDGRFRRLPRQLYRQQKDLGKSAANIQNCYAMWKWNSIHVVIRKRCVKGVRRSA